MNSNPFYRGITATQGVLFTEVFDAIDTYLFAILGTDLQKIYRWFYKGRPAIQGFDTNIWWRLNDAGLLASPGPLRFGTKENLDFTLVLETRCAADSSQMDFVKLDRHYSSYMKLINSLSGSMLFPAYQAIDEETGQDASPFIPPEPVEGLPPLSVEPMLVKAPGGDKVQQEEWTISSSMGLVVPCVLKLTV